VISNDRPIIGVLTHPPIAPLIADGFIVASYVKWIEAGGARVTVIPVNASSTEIERLFNSVNGILFTGGATEPIIDDTEYYRTAKMIYQLTIDANNNGDYFPLWGTCLGLELLSILSSNNQTLMDGIIFDSMNLTLPLE